MNNAIANILKQQLIGLPMLDKVAGLVQVAEYPSTTYDEQNIPTRIIKRVPISTDVAYDPVFENNDLVPDSSKKGIAYFEDRGVRTLSRIGRHQRYSSRLRLVVWLNAKTLTSSNLLLKPALINHIVGKFQELQNRNAEMFLKLDVAIEGIPVSDASIFAPYTYDLYTTQFVMAPYEFFAIDISVNYQMDANCLTQITLGPDVC